MTASQWHSTNITACYHGNLFDVYGNVTCKQGLMSSRAQRSTPNIFYVGLNSGLNPIGAPPVGDPRIHRGGGANHKGGCAHLLFWPIFPKTA